MHVFDNGKVQQAFMPELLLMFFEFTVSNFDLAYH